jgi:hypothetical protein
MIPSLLQDPPEDTSIEAVHLLRQELAAQRAEDEELQQLSENS